MLTRVLILGVTLLAGMAVTGAAQTGRHHGSQDPSDNPSTPTLEAVFTGTVNSVTKSDLEIQIENGNVLSFSILHKTRFVKDGKTIKRTDLHNGDAVTIQAAEDPTGHPAAITVTLGKVPQPSS